MITQGNFSELLMKQVVDSPFDRLWSTVVQIGGVPVPQVVDEVLHVIMDIPRSCETAAQ